MTQQKRGIESRGSTLRTRKMMTKLEAIVQPSRFEAVKEVATELGIRRA